MNPTELQQKLGKAAERARKWKGEHRRLEGVSRGETRKRDTRRKIWAGGWLLNIIREDAALREKFAAHLRTIKLRKDEAALFADLLATAPPAAADGAATAQPVASSDSKLMAMADVASTNHG